MLKPLALCTLAMLSLSACETPTTPNLVIGQDALARGGAITPETIIPRVSSRTAVQTFENFCGRFIGNPAGTRRAVQGAGYFLLGSGTLQGLEMWASDDARPLVATGRENGAEVCMIMIAEDASLGPAAAAYVVQKHGTSAMSMGTMQLGDNLADNLYIVPTEPPVIYFTMIQDQPNIGRIHAFAVATE